MQSDWEDYATVQELTDFKKVCKLINSKASIHGFQDEPDEQT